MAVPFLRAVDMHSMVVHRRQVGLRPAVHRMVVTTTTFLQC